MRTHSHLTTVRAGFPRAVQRPYTPISTRTNSAHVPRHAHNGVDRPVSVQHDHARARAVSERLGDLCRHEKDSFEQCPYRPHVEVAREVLQARDLLIDLEKGALHPALNEEWKIVSDFNVGIVEVLKLKKPVLVTVFIAQRLGEATASEKTGAIRTAHAQLKELKAMRGNGGFAELANWVIPPPGRVSV